MDAENSDSTAADQGAAGEARALEPTAVVEQPVAEPDLEADYPGRDPWLYCANDPGEWEDEKPATYGRRRVHFRREVLTGGIAVWKGDKEHLEAFTEKVCADLAQILRLPVPAGMIDRWPDTDEIAFVARKPAIKIKELKQVRGDFRINPLDERRLHELSPRYPAGLIAFDLWVDNWDQHSENMLMVRDTGKLWAFDYGCVFGMVPKQTKNYWEGDGFKQPISPQPGFPGRNLPVPIFVHSPDINRAAVLACAKKIEELPENLIRYVVNRAATPYGDHGAADVFAQEVADRLCYRRREVMGWIQTRLP